MGRLIQSAIELGISLFLGGMVMVAAARITYHDPFATYAQIMPGQSTDALDTYHCRLHTTFKNLIVSEGNTRFCQFIPDDRFFASITVYAWGTTITRISFLIQPNQIRFGDLLWCWGTPSHTMYYPRGVPAVIQVRWQKSQIVALMSYHENLSPYFPFQPITDLIFTSDQDPSILKAPDRALERGQPLVCGSPPIVS